MLAMTYKGNLRSIIKDITYCACIIFIFLAACQPAPNPRKVLTGCLDAILKGDPGKAYNYFSFADMNTWSLTEYVKRYRLPIADSCIAARLRKKSTYTTEEVLATKDSVRFLLQVTASEIMGTMLASFMEITDRVRCDSTLDTNDIIHYISRYTGSALVLKQTDGWSVFGNWQKQQGIEGRLAQEKLDYIERFLKIDNIRVRVYENTQKTVLTATLFNSGDRIITDVEIMITGYNKENKPCLVLSEHPVSESTKPLQKKSSRKFTVKISLVPEEWTRFTDIKVVNCRFNQ